MTGEFFFNFLKNVMNIYSFFSCIIINYTSFKCVDICNSYYH